MKRIITLLLTVALVICCFVGCGKTESDTTTAATTATTEATTEATTADTSLDGDAFYGDMEKILNGIVNRAIEIEKQNWTEDVEYYGIGTIECEPTFVDEDSCTSILGLETDEFNNYVESAIESKPLGSWYTHSIVVVKLKSGVNVSEVANKIVANTLPNRFGCLKPSAIVGAYTGSYVIFTASDAEACEAVYSAVTELSSLPVTIIDRENNWTGGGLFVIDPEDL